MNGKRCVVTGAASGIGDAVARLLIERGATVVSLDRNEPTVAVEQHVKVDLTDLASINAALDELTGEFDVLCNVAGLPGTHPAEAVFRVNFLAARHIAEAFFDRLRPGGAIVNVASTAGFGWPNRLDQIRDLLGAVTYDDGAQWFKENPQQGNAYNFSKEAITVYTMAMASGLVEAGVRMNAVSPGPVETPILVDFEESMGKDIIDGVKELVGRHAEPIDIARAVAFLASPESGWVNGHNIIADGGIAGAVLTGIVPAPGDLEKEATVGFANADEVVHYIGGIFETAFADETIGPKLVSTGIVLLVRSTDPVSAFIVDMANSKVLPGDDGAEPSATMTMSAAMQNSYWQGKVNLPFAMARGQVKVEGNVAQLLKLAPLGKSLYPVYIAQLKADGRDDLVVA